MIYYVVKPKPDKISEIIADYIEKHGKPPQMIAVEEDKVEIKTELLERTGE